MTRKVILDTDIGSDIDDAVCLAYLLAKPDCELLGITTVTGQPVERAKLASALCTEAGQDIPIFPGAPEPLLVDQMQKEAPQAKALGNWPHRKDFPVNGALDFLQATIRDNPGEVDLVAIGPMTNLGLLFRMDPELPSLLRGLVLMIGRFSNRVARLPHTEWNSLLDPAASAIVFRSRPPVHRSIGLDVTTQVTMEAGEVRRRFQSGLLKPVADFAEHWFSHSATLTFHDPLAATTLFRDDICSFERGRVDVELEGTRYLQGLTHWTPEKKAGGDSPHEVALEVRPETFFDEFFTTLA